VGRTNRSEIHTLINFIWNTKEFPEDWKQSITVPIYKKDDKADCINYRGMSLFKLRTRFHPTSCRQGLTPHAKEIVGDHQCGFRRNKSTTDHTVCFHLILKKKCEGNEAVH
jgi:hypothetical protein